MDIKLDSSEPRGNGPASVSDGNSGTVGNTFAALVHDVGRDREQAIDAIRAGFSATVLKDAGIYLDVPPNRIRAVVRLPETTAQALLKRGSSMDAATSERIWRLADVMAMAKGVFEDVEAAKTWLRTGNLTVGGAAPMDYLDTEPGAMTVATGGAL